ncbi:MAG: metal-dependent hydrolase [Desulfamplus sp.]|nr:metal-dependent hydrolase [Desulfamplus sp.]
MSGFRTHLIGGMAAGGAVAAGTAIFKPALLDPVQLSALFITGTIGGILPDLDSDTGKPLSILFGLISILVPVAFLEDLAQYFTITPEFLVTYFVICYFIINFPVCAAVKKITVHRGIMHSIPFAVLCAQASFFIFMPSGKSMAMAGAVSMLAGCITHLVLDELNSIVWKFGCIPVFKNSIGSALKFKSSSLSATFLIYLLAGLGGVHILNQLAP